MQLQGMYMIQMISMHTGIGTVSSEEVGSSDEIMRLRPHSQTITIPSMNIFSIPAGLVRVSL